MPTDNKYKEAGVDIDAGNRLVDKIKPLAAATARIGTMDSIGGFAGLFDLKALGYRDPILVACTDGVGTKLKIAIETDHHDTIGIDLVAMCVNDLVVQGAEPLFFLDYFATGALNVEQAREVIAGIAEGCTQAGCALIGGETAEMPGMYGAEDYDLAGFSVGVVERDGILPRKDALAAGDVILGLASTGVHSNGFSLVRHILKAHHLNLSDAAPFSPGDTFGEALLAPTRIYVKSCMEAIRTGKVKALAHITGGGLIENLPRILPESLGAHIDAKSWERPEVFPWLQAQGSISALEMLRTFNSGIGMVVVVAPEHAQPVTELLTRAGEKVYAIGALKARRHSSVEIGGI